MGFEFTHEEQRDLLKLLQVDKAICGSRSTVLRVFETLRRRIMERRPDSFGDDSLFAATEWLLYAHEQRELDWNALATILKHRANYTAVFCFLGGEPKDYGKGFENARTKKWWQRKHDRRRYVEKLAKRRMKEDFVATIRWLVEYLDSKDTKKSSVSKKDILAGRSPEFLLHLWDFGRYDAYGRPEDDRDRPKLGAHVYEAELLADDGFVSERDQIVKAVCAKHPTSWWFRIGEDGKGAFEVYDGRRRSIQEINEAKRIGVDPGADLLSFCRKWCLHEVAVRVGHTKSGNRASIAAQRVRVRRAESGVEVFIPRYYNFNDIRYRRDDFKALKHALDESYGILSLRKSRRGKVEEAKRLRKSLVAQGWSRAAAWDETKVRIGWEESTMAHYLGHRPAEHRIDYGQRLPRGTKLPSP